MGELIARSGMPKWAWSIIFTVILALMSFGISAIAGNQKMKDNIQTNANNIERHDKEMNDALKDKASKEKVDMTYDIVLRIEGKLDEHMKHD